MKLLLTLPFVLLAMVIAAQNAGKTPIKAILPLSIYNLNGDTTNLQTVGKGKVTFIDFWFVPCGPCFAEMHMLHKLYAKYKDNPNVAFLTITFTDSAFVRPLTENRNAIDNDTYDYFKTLAELDTFSLPVYFLKGATTRMVSFKKMKMGFSGRTEPDTSSHLHYPDNVFGFSAYPTIFIFGTNGHTIYSRTGFMKKTEGEREKEIQAVIERNVR